MSSQDAQDPMPERETGPDPVSDTALPLAEPEPVAEPARPDPKPQRRGSGLVLAALLLGGGATAMAWFDPLGWRGDGALQAEVAALTARLDASETASKALTDRLAALESAPDDAEALTALQTAVKANEAALQALQDAPPIGGDVSASYVASLAQAIEDLKQQIATMSATPATPEGVKAAVDTAVDAAIAQLAAEQEAKAQASVEVARQQATRIEAVEQVRAAARSGAPFAEVLPALEGLTVSPVLRDAAETGMVTQQALTEAFPDAARNALDAALRAEGGESLGDRLYGFLRIQTGARSLTPRDGTDPDAVLSRAEAAVRSGQVQAALDELAALPPEAQAEMTDWVAMAQTWLATQQALNDLAAAAGLQGG